MFADLIGTRDDKLAVQETGVTRPHWYRAAVRTDAHRLVFR
jgi:hypothetical protein